jgi:hypothetical protein
LAAYSDVDSAFLYRSFTRALLRAETLVGSGASMLGSQLLIEEDRSFSDAPSKLKTFSSLAAEG